MGIFAPPPAQLDYIQNFICFVVSLVFIAILREGFEIVLFYVALISSSVDSGFEILLGGGLGVAGLIGLFIIMRKSMDKVPTDTIFQCSKYLFIIGSIYFAYLGGSEVYELLTETH